jgi:hypothetical protein
MNSSGPCVSCCAAGYDLGPTRRTPVDTSDWGRGGCGDLTHKHCDQLQ